MFFCKNLNKFKYLSHFYVCASIDTNKMQLGVIWFRSHVFNTFAGLKWTKRGEKRKMELELELELVNAQP